MEQFINCITKTIGNTPLLRLDKIKAHYCLEGNIFAKLEHLNPSFSKKDRVALEMIEAAEKRGHLKAGQTVLEMTSGNTGTAVALVCSAKGYRFVCVMSRGNSVERIKMIEAFGGEVVLVDQSPNSVKGKVSGEDLRLVEIEAERIKAETGAFFLNQFENYDNPAAQEKAANEMWRQSGGDIDFFADFIGTGGTFEGYSKALKRHKPSLRCYAVEPFGCAFYKDELFEGANHGIQGGGYAKDMPVVDRTHIDGCVTVTHEEAVELTQLLAKLEGVFAGFSSGANLAAAIKLMQDAESGKNAAIVINDCGLKYMSANLY